MKYELRNQTGPAPNQLLLSLLSHPLATQLVSHSATLQHTQSITRLVESRDSQVDTTNLSIVLQFWQW